MRNYFSTKGLAWRAFLFDDTHSPQGDFPLFAIGRNSPDLKTQVDIQNSSVTSGLPPLWTVEFTYDVSELTIFFTLDKENFMVIAQAFAGSFVLDAISNQPPFYPLLVNPKTSPRYTGWRDEVKI